MNPLYAALAARRIFVIWRGSDKSPIDPLHAEPASDFARSNAQDPATWLLPSVALGYASMLGPGYGVGIVISKGCGLFCVDLDGCIAPDGSLSEIARTLVSEFSGCYIETSMSGRGLHIIGSYAGEAPTHGTKNIPQHIELYTESRYIALTGNLLA